MSKKKKYTDFEDRDLKDYIEEAKLVLSKEVEVYAEISLEIKSFKLLPNDKEKLSNLSFSISSYCEDFLENLDSEKILKVNYINYTKSKESFDTLLDDILNQYEENLSNSKYKLKTLRDKELTKNIIDNLCNELKIPVFNFSESTDKIDFKGVFYYITDSLKDIINHLTYIKNKLDDLDNTYIFPSALLEQLIAKPIKNQLEELVKNQALNGLNYTKDNFQDILYNSIDKTKNVSTELLDRNGLGFIRELGLTKLPFKLLKSAFSIGKKVFNKDKEEKEIDTSEFSDGFIKKGIEKKQSSTDEENSDNTIIASKVNNSSSDSSFLSLTNSESVTSNLSSKFLPSISSITSGNDELIKALGENFSYLANSQTLVSNALKKQSNSIDTLSDTILNGMDNLSVTSDNIKKDNEDGDDILSSVTDFFKGKGGKLKKVGGKVGTLLKSAGAFLVSGTGLAATAATVFGGTGLYSVYKGIKGEDASNWISNISDKIYQKVSGNKSGGIGTGIYNLLHDDEGNNKIGKLLTSTKDKILSVSATAANTAISKYKIIKDKAGDIWNNTKTLVSNTIKNPLDSVKAGFSNMFKFLSKIPGIGQFFDKVSPVKVDYLKTAKDFLKTIFQLLVSGIKSILPDKISNMLLGGDNNSQDGSSEGIVQRGINWTKDKLGFGNNESKTSVQQSNTTNVNNSGGNVTNNTVNNSSVSSSPTLNNSSITSDSEGIASVTPKSMSNNSSTQSSTKVNDRFTPVKLNPTGVTAPTESQTNNYSNVSTMLNSNYEDISDIGIKMLAGSLLI